MNKFPVMLRASSVFVFLLFAAPVFAAVHPVGPAEPFFAERNFESFIPPEKWEVRNMPTGRDFHFCLYWRGFRTVIDRPGGPAPFGDSFEFARDAIVRIIEPTTPRTADLDDLLNNRTNPVFLWVPHRARPGVPAQRFSPEWMAAQPTTAEDVKEALRIKEAFGSRFLALDNIEWCYGMNIGDGRYESATSEEILGLPPPRDRDEAAKWYGMNWDMRHGKYQEAGLPIWSGNSIAVNHFEGRKGTAYTGNEMSYNEPWHDPVRIAVARGTARQFGIPWGQYIADSAAVYSGGRPDVRRLTTGGHYYTGPHGGGASGGGSTGIYHGKRILFHCYMAGVNFFIRENDYTSLISDYDPLTVEKTDPYILALRELDERYASPYALMWEDFYKNIVKKRDRGVPYTPVALLRDKNDGFDIHYAKHGRAVGRVPFTRGDEMTRDMLFELLRPPYEHHAFLSARRRARGNYAGEIYDVLTAEAPEEVLKSYRAIVLMGDVRVDRRLEQIFERFVKNGGLLLMVCEQMTPGLWKLAGIADTGLMGRESGFRGAYLRATDHFAYYGQGDFEYRKVLLKGAEPLFVPNNFENRVWPIATINRVGKGAVIAAAVPWLHHGDRQEGTTYSDGTRITRQRGMYGLFTEIMGMIADEIVPVQVRGDEVKVMYNRNEAGWVVTLINEEGKGGEWPFYAYPEFPITRPAARGLSSAGVVMAPVFDFSSATEWLTGAELSAQPCGALGIVVPPGGVRVVEFTLK